ncbi:flagellar biosynthesis protein FlhA [Mariniblastus sp.]|nr:flagellar biosynthesis protein FlhA [Mariniblastus sp.]MDB4756289.1 flagellar biosynthesis protein FlhA [Mariniblastus sp.]
MTEVPKSDSNTFFAMRSELAIAVGALAVFIVLLIPMPTFMLDMFLAVNLALSVMLLLVTLNAKEALEVSVFPSLLLLLTLYRLALNVATTRLILSDGDAGKIVDTFGGMIVGNSMVVGIVIFLILVIIQFIVITKGATRISEVNARFVLDAMPGKQMAIDAELTSQAINKDEAQARRLHLTREAEFYGAMDGASKYVRGDAIAGLIITAINLIGGIVIGMMDSMTINEAASTYSRLTVGDGLVSQIPALIIATTSGILVTKASSDQSLGQEVGAQMLSNRKPMLIAGGVLVLIAFIPGLPKIPFLALAGVCFFVARKMPSAPITPTKESETGPTAEQPIQTKEEQTLNEFVNSDKILVQVGLGLAGMIENGKSIGLAERAANLRKDLANTDGFWVPAVRIRSNPELHQNHYVVFINNRKVGNGELRPGDYMAINPGTATLEIDGETTVEPAFGLEAKWIPANLKQRADLGGYTVVDMPTVLITHLSELFRRYAHELLGLEDLQKMLQQVESTAPTVVSELKPEVIRMGTLRRVLANLLSEKVSISALENILESVAHHGQQIKDPQLLCDYVRQDIGHTICERFQTQSGEMQVIMLDPKLESQFREMLHDGNLGLPPKPLENLIGQLRESWEKFAVQEQNVAVLTDFQLRRPIRNAIFRALPDVSVISFTEIPKDLHISAIAYVRNEQVFEANPLTPGMRSDNQAGGLNQKKTPVFDRSTAGNRQSAGASFGTTNPLQAAS